MIRSKMRLLIAFLSILNCLALVSFSNKNKAREEFRKPNVIVIVADDLGYADVGFNGSDIKTPNLDRLAGEGVRLEQFYTCPMCSPTRAGLLTGKYPLRFGLMRSVIPPQREFGLPSDEETMAEMMEKAGYKYRGIIGKWHLGHRQQKWLPLNQGFTYHEGCYNGAVDYFDQKRDGERDWHQNFSVSQKQGYTTDLIGQASVDFIKSVPTSDPFFLYVPFTAPHSPFQAKEEDLKKYPDRNGVKRTYAAMVDCMDQNIGKIMDCLRERGQLENTFIIFFSDNGGVEKAGDNGSLRGYKLTPYQGGINVAAAACWIDGGISGGKTISSLMGYIDVLPTLSDAVGYNAGQKLDGKSVLNALQGHGAGTREWFTYLDQDGEKMEQLAVINKNWKLIWRRNAPDNPTAFDKVELYDLSVDPFETTDLSEKKPELILQLKTTINQFYGLKSKKQIPRYYEKEKLSGSVITDWQPVN
ncbi:MAG: sulfatase [Mangrovibacterium sp.]